MIEDVIVKIKDAEEAAASLKLEAENRAEAIRAKADEDYARVVEETKKTVRVKKENILLSARNAAAEEYSAEIDSAKEDGRRLVGSYEKSAEEAAEDLFGRIKNGDL